RAPAASRVWRGAINDGPTLEFDGRVLRVGATEAEAVQPLLDALRAAGAVITGVRLVRPTLEDLFIAAVTDPETGRARDVGAQRDARKEDRR
ncbi:MAG: hypothetical protein D6693_02320, partial [Planctomycetota bacterium]